MDNSDATHEDPLDKEVSNELPPDEYDPEAEQEASDEEGVDEEEMDIPEGLEDLGREEDEASAGRAEEMRDQIEEFYERGEHQIQAARQRARDINHRAVTFVRERPLASLAIGFGVGYLLGRLARSRLLR